MRLTGREKLSYALGAVGKDMVYMLSASYVLYYYQDIMGVSAITMGVIIMAATNRPDILDPALLRPGRFDRQVTVNYPDVVGREAILRVHARNKPIGPDVKLDEIARATSGFTGADLENLLNEAALLAARRGKKALTKQEIEEATIKVVVGTEKKFKKVTDEEKKLTAYHEAGHAVTNYYLDTLDPVHQISIIPRGMAMGATMFLPETDRYDITENEAYDMMAMGMGGRCAEQLIFNELTSGGSMDIQQATNMAKRMVCEWGMSKKLGPLNYAAHQDHIFLGRDITRTEGVSPETEREIDLEVRRIVDAAEARAMDILTEHKDKLIKLAEELLERETMNADEVYELLDLPKRILSNEPFEDSKTKDNTETSMPPQIPVEENAENNGNDGN